MGTQSKIKSLVRTFRRKSNSLPHYALTRTARRLAERAGHPEIVLAAPTFHPCVETHGGREYFVSREYRRRRTMHLRRVAKHERRGPMSRKGCITIVVEDQVDG